MARLQQLDIRQTHYLGRAKTKIQMYLTATVINLIIAGEPIGVFGNLGYAADRSVATSQISGNHGVRCHRLPTRMLA